MSSSIDKRIVEMTFDGKQFQSGVSTSLTSIDNLKKGLDFTGAARSVGGLSEAFKRFTLGKIAEDVGQVNNKLSIMGIAGMRVIQNLTDATIRWGKTIIDSVTGLAAAKAGLAEYETQINAIQTISANTSSKGTTMAEIKDALAELNTYADKTIYNFTEMTRNIGTFTAAGTDLDTSVAAIKGIANLAAVSGSTSLQASTGMYQLSQAISAGTVRLQDWNSVTNAGMGGEVFKNALMDTARVHGIAIDKIVKDEGGFRTSLDKGWLSSAILLETLEKFTGDVTEAQLLATGYTKEQAAEILKLGVVANDAATKVKTFTQLKDTLKEMAQSGWTKTWELIVGDFDQAKEVFTGLSYALGNIVDATSDARNKVLNTWNQLGGRESLITSASAAFKILNNVITPLKQAFTDIFPPITGQQLMRFTYLLQGLIQQIKITEEGADKIKRTFRGVFAVFDIVKLLVISLAKGIGALLKPLFALGDGFGSTAANIGDWLVGLRDSIKAGDVFGKAISNVVEFIHALVGWVVLAGITIRDFFVKMGESARQTRLLNHLADGKAATKITTVWEGIIRIFESLSKTIKSLGGKIGPMFDKFKRVDVSGLTNKLNQFKDTITGLKKVTSDSGKSVNGFQLVLEKLQPVLDKVKEFSKKAFSWLGKLVKDGLSQLSFENILSAINTALLGVFTLGAKGVFNDLSKLLTGGFLVAITTAITNFINKGSKVFDGVSGILDGVQGSLTAWQNSLKAKTLMEIAKAVALIAASVLILSFVDATKLGYATAAITVLFADLMASFAIFNKVGGGSLGGNAGMLMALYGISGALLLLSVSLLILSKIDWEAMKVGLAGLAGITVIIVAASQGLSKNTGTFLKASIGLNSFALGILAVAGVVYLLGRMDVTVLNNGLLTLGAIIAGFVAFSRGSGSPSKALAGAASMVILAGGIYILSLSLKTLGEMKPEVLKQGLIGMSVGLGVLFAALQLMPKDMAIKAFALTVLSFALTLLAQAMTSMGNMTWENVARGLAVMGGSLLILAGGLRLMTGAIPGALALLVASFALKTLAEALTVMGALPLEQIGIALLAVVGIFAVLGLAGLILGPLIPVLLGLGASMLLFGIAALAFGLGISTLAAGVAVLAASGAAGVAVFALFVTTFLTLLPMIVTQLGLAFGAFIDAITTNAPKIFEAVKVILLGLIDTMVAVIPELMAAVVVFVTAMVDALVTTIPMVIDAAFQLIMALLTEIRDNIGEMTTVAIEIVTEFIDAVAAKIPDVIESATNLIISFIDGLALAVERDIPRILESLRNLADAMIDGLMEGLGEGAVFKVITRITEIGADIIKALKAILGIKSPSTVTTEIGKLTDMGLVKGLTAFMPKVSNAAKAVGKTAISSLTNAVSNISDVLTGTIDMNPTIRPVLDLTDIMAGEKTINKYLDKEHSVNLSGSLQRTSGINVGQNQAVVNGQMVDKMGNPITFNQYNYSPEALSRFDIYRQTRNQLNLMKGLVKP